MKSRQPLGGTLTLTEFPEAISRMESTFPKFDRGSMTIHSYYDLDSHHRYLVLPQSTLLDIWEKSGLSKRSLRDGIYEDDSFATGMETPIKRSVSVIDPMPFFQA